MDKFLSRFRQPSEIVSTKLDSKAKEIVQNNLQVVESLIKMILLCGKQGLALQGHCDDGIDLDDPGEPNVGNFLELVRFRAETEFFESICSVHPRMPNMHQKSYKMNSLVSLEIIQVRYTPRS